MNIRFGLDDLRVYTHRIRRHAYIIYIAPFPESLSDRTPQYYILLYVQ